MARSWQYPRWRRYVMQGTMWLILGATVGLAALVNHERRRSMRVELGPPIAKGWLVVRLPRTWQAQSASVDRDARVIARAIEPDEQGLGRTVTVTRDVVADPISPLEYLLYGSNQIMGLDLLAAQHARGERQLVEPIEMGGFPGVLVRGVRASGRGTGAGAGAGELPHKEVYAATVVPSGHAIVIKLEGDRPAELSDVEIVKQLAGAVEVGAQPTLGQSGETVALESSIRFSVPDGFRPVYEKDEQFVRRRLWPQGDVTRWSAAELVPCLLSPTESGDETMAIKALAAVHDPGLRDATVSADGARRWRITPPGSAGPFAVRGFLLADELGDAGAITGGPRRALMAFFHGAAGPEDDTPTQAAWDALARSVSFVGKTDFGALLEAGKAEAARLKAQGLSPLLGGNRGKQWWIWTDEPEKKHVGWSHVTWALARSADATLPKTSNGTIRSGFRGADGRFTRVKTTWTGELKTYDGFNRLVPPAPAEPVMRHSELSGGKLAINLASSGRPIVQGSGDGPPHFVPGPWLGLLIGKLYDKPMILQTDSFLANETIGAPVPLTLIVQAITEKPAPVEADGTPLRCLSIRVNGSGEASRWYVRENGTVHHVAFARGLVRTPSDDKTVIFTFEPEVSAPW